MTARTAKKPMAREAQVRSCLIVDLVIRLKVELGRRHSTHLPGEVFKQAATVVLALFGVELCGHHISPSDASHETATMICLDRSMHLPPSRHWLMEVEQSLAFSILLAGHYP